MNLEKGVVIAIYNNINQTIEYLFISGKKETLTELLLYC